LGGGGVPLIRPKLANILHNFSKKSSTSIGKLLKSSEICGDMRREKGEKWAFMGINAR
jgi:hypothetical protein